MPPTECIEVSATDISASDISVTDASGSANIASGNASDSSVAQAAPDFSFTTGDVLAAAAGGFVGAIFRYVIMVICANYFFKVSPFSRNAYSFLFYAEIFPNYQEILTELNISETTGIFIVNMLGCFLLGFVLSDVFILKIPILSKVFSELGILAENTSTLFFGTGVAGSLSTFAGFIINTFGQAMNAMESKIIYILPILCLVEVLLGLGVFCFGNSLPKYLTKKVRSIKQMILYGHVDKSVYSGNVAYINVEGDETEESDKNVCVDISESVNAESVNAECGNAECGNAECGNAECGNAECVNAECVNAECGNAEYTTSGDVKNDDSRSADSICYPFISSHCRNRRRAWRRLQICCR